MNASARAGFDDIMAWEQPDSPSIEQKKCLQNLGIAGRITKKADDRRRPKVIRETPAKRMEAVDVHLGDPGQDDN